jgi:hypothetical protein
MDQHRKRTPHARTLSLIPLESALIAAERLTPSRAPRPDMDPNEMLAAQLIERIKHPQPVSFPGLRIESPRPLVPTMILETAGRDV